MSTIDPHVPVLVAFDGVGATDNELTDTPTGVAAVLRELIAAKGEAQANISKELGLPQSHVSRWLNPRSETESHRGSLIPIWALAKLADTVGRSVLIALIDKRLTHRPRSRTPAARKLRQFFLGMGFINLRETPNSILDLLADVWGAQSWMLYGESPGRNILECTPSESILNPELVAGPSWASELPTRVLNTDELLIRDWQKDDAKEPSAFAMRENVKFCVGLPVRSHSARSHVVFLNFESPPHDSALDPDVLRTVTRTLRGFLNSRSSEEAQPSVSGQRGVLPSRTVGELVQQAFHSPDPTTLARSLCHEIATSIPCAMWPHQRTFLDVWALENATVSLSQRPGEVTLLSGPANTTRTPDHMVRRAAANGETFYVDDLNRSNVRGRFDREDLIPEGRRQKTVLPIRCERLLGTDAQPEDLSGLLRERDDQIIYRLPAPERRDAQSWGAISVETEYPPLSRDNVYELSMVAHLIACVLYVRSLPDATDLLKVLSSGIDESIDRIKRAKASREASAREPLAPLCQSVILNDVFDGIERCDIYPFDHGVRKFLDGGAYTHPAWIRELKESASVLLDGNRVKHLTPRKGGNSERLIGTRDEYHIILDAAKHPRVSPITKMTGTRSLVGCSCRVGASFKSDAVIWMGSRKRLSKDYLEAENYERLMRLRILSHIAAIFCVMIRWWVPQTDSTSRTAGN